MSGVHGDATFDGLPGSWGSFPHTREPEPSIIVPADLELPVELHGFSNIVQSPVVPEGTAYVVAHRPGLTDVYSVGSVLFQQNPWPEAPAGMPDYAARERDRALDFLAGLLDDWCASTTVNGVPLDPEDVWRGPKIHEARWLRDRIRFDATMTLAMPVIRPESFAVIVP